MPPTPEAPAGPVPPPPETGRPEATPWKTPKTTSLFALLQMTRAMSDTTAPAAPAPAVEMDELEKYLQRPQLPVTDGFNVLGWWRAHKGIYPNLVKMVREVLACPLSSAGVERLFSGAGKLMGDEQRNMIAPTMKATLFAATLKD